MASHRYWRVSITAVQSGSYPKVAELELRATFGGPNLATDPARWSANNFWADNPPSLLADGDQYTWYESENAVYVDQPVLLTYDFGEGNEQDITEFMLQFYLGAGAPRDFQLLTSDDGISWTPIYNITNQNAWYAYEKRVYHADVSTVEKLTVTKAHALIIVNEPGPRAIKAHALHIVSERHLSVTKAHALLIVGPQKGMTITKSHVLKIVGAPKGTNIVKAHALTIREAPLPTVTEVSPPEGVYNYQVVTVRGTGLTGTYKVTFYYDDLWGKFSTSEWDLGTNIQNISDTEIRVTAPLLASNATYKLYIWTAHGEVSSDVHTYTPRYPVYLDTVNPSMGPVEGGNTVTLSGGSDGYARPDGSSLILAVLFGGVPATDIQVLTDHSLTCKPPARGGAGAVDVQIIAVGGTATRTAGYTYIAPVVISSIEPIDGPSTGATPVTIRGSGFFSTLNVYFRQKAADGTSYLIFATRVSAVGDHTIVVNSPPWDTERLGPCPETGGKADIYLYYTAAVTAELVDAFTYIDAIAQKYIFLMCDDGTVEPIKFSQLLTGPRNKILLTRAPHRPLVDSIERVRTKFLINPTQNLVWPNMPFLVLEKEAARPSSFTVKIKAVNDDPLYYGGDGGVAYEDEWPWGPGDQTGKVDLLLVLDTTGSMSGRAGAMLNSVRSWLSSISARGMNVWASVVTFGDAWNCGAMPEFDGDSTQWPIVGYARPFLNLSPASTAHTFLSSVPVGGGEDASENPLGALMFGLENVRFRPGARIVAYIATDNPAHQAGDPIVTLTGQEFKDAYYMDPDVGPLSAWPGWFPPSPAAVIAKCLEMEVLVHTSSMLFDRAGMYEIKGLSDALGGQFVEMPGDGVMNLTGLRIPGY